MNSALSTLIPTVVVMVGIVIALAAIDVLVQGLFKVNAQSKFAV